MEQAIVIVSTGTERKKILKQGQDAYIKKLFFFQIKPMPSIQLRDCLAQYLN